MQNSVTAQRIENGWDWFFKRNCSISPYQLAGIFIFLGIVSLTIGTTFYMMGATLILPYCFVEIFVQMLAFFYNAKHANDYEQLVLQPNVIKIIHKKGELVNSIELNIPYARVELISEKQDLILISHGAQQVHFGNHIHPNLRSRLSSEIKLKL